MRSPLFQLVVRYALVVGCIASAIALILWITEVSYLSLYAMVTIWVGSYIVGRSISVDPSQERYRHDPHRASVILTVACLFAWFIASVILWLSRNLWGELGLVGSSSILTTNFLFLIWLTFLHYGLCRLGLLGAGVVMVRAIDITKTTKNTSVDGTEATLEERMPRFLVAFTAFNLSLAVVAAIGVKDSCSIGGPEGALECALDHLYGSILLMVPVTLFMTFFLLERVNAWESSARPDTAARR